MGDKLLHIYIYEQGMWEPKRNIFSFEYFEYFQPKIGWTKNDIKPGPEKHSY